MAYMNDDERARWLELQAKLNTEEARQQQEEAKLRAQASGLPFVILSKYRPEPFALERIPRSLAAASNVIPLKFDESLGRHVLYVAIADPGNLEALNAVRLACRCMVKGVLASSLEIQVAIEHYYPPSEKETPNEAS